MWSSRTAPDPRWAFESVDVLLDRQRLRKDAHALVRLQRAAAICDTMVGEVAQALRTPGLPRPDRTRGRREENMAPIRLGDRVVVSVTSGPGARPPTRKTRSQVVFGRRACSAFAAESRGSAVEHFPDAREGDRLRFQPTHFIGLDYAEYPTALTSRPPQHDRALATLGPLADYPLEPDMTIEVHPNVCPPGLGLAAVGDIFVVASDGGRRLTSCPVDLQIISPR